MAKLPSWIYRQSAVLPCRRRGGDLEVLIVTSRKGTRWVLPKGIVEPGMTPPASAAKEAREEAGIEGRIMARSLGRYTYKKWGGTCDVEVFPMAVMTELEDWPERGFRRRAWVSLEAAGARLDPDKLRKILRRLPEAIEEDRGDGQISDMPGKPPHVLYLLRHAKSSWEDPSIEDFDRPLASRGRQAGETMAGYMRLADVRPDLVLCSSSLRTRQTLKRILPAFAADVPVEYEDALYHDGAGELMTRLRRVPDCFTSVLMIGHNPALQALAVRLAGDGDPDARARLETKFPTAGLVTLVLRRERWQDLGPDACELHSFVVPRELA